jgi:trehalose 6-phosphate phosphatase
MRLIQQLRCKRFKIAAVTSSENCNGVLRAAKLDDLFEVRVEGNVIQAQRLAGKPASETSRSGAERDGCRRGCHFRVEAASNGNFGLVIDVGRKANAKS